MDKAAFSVLFHGYLDDRLTAGQLREFREAAQDPQYAAYLDDLLAETISDELPYETSATVDLGKMRRKLMADAWEGPSSPARWWRWAAAAVVIVAAGTLFYTLRMQPSRSVNITAETDVAPAFTGAVLTLGDGTSLELDSLTGDRLIARQGGTNVTMQGGKLQYDGAGGEVMYNQLRTPRGRIFQLTLPDGSIVWLNAASSIRYPTSFKGNSRNVEITGEVYFDVVANSRQPFMVKYGDSAWVKVLGTEFNVNAYPNGKSVATLVSGAIQVGAGKYQYPLREQGGHVTIVKGAMPQMSLSGSIDKVVAWKNGLFNFNDVPLEEAMLQLERWYDIEVVFENGVPDVSFGGEISRNVSLAGLLRILARADLSFRIEKDRKLIITNK